MKREIAKSRPESRPRPRARRDFFFLIHVQSSKSTRHFKFCTNSVSVSPRSFLKRSSLEPRTAIEGSFSGWGGLRKLDRGLVLCEPFFPDSDSDSDSDETFQISRKLGLVLFFVFLFFCLLDSQPWRAQLANPNKRLPQPLPTLQGCSHFTMKKLW